MSKLKSLLKLFTVFSLLAVVFSLGSLAVPPSSKTLGVATTQLNAAYPATVPIELMASTVRIQVSIEATRQSFLSPNEVLEEPVVQGWSGSGVVYDKTDRLKGAVRSRILTANHVLDTPAIGSVSKEMANLFGVSTLISQTRIDAVKITMQTADGRTCNMKVLALGSSDTHDVATGEADCDAGRVAKLGNAEPVMGERVFICGYPLGVFSPMLTEGFVSGWTDGYLLTTAPAYSGNSGGPVFHKGKVIGLLVRGSREYTNVTLTVSLEECLRRIAETPPL